LAAGSDLLDAWEDLLACYVDNVRRLDETLAGLIGRASDELYYWLRYREQDPNPGHDRLARFDVADSAALPPAAPRDGLDPLVLTHLGRLRDHRPGIRPPPPEPSPIVP